MGEGGHWTKGSKKCFVIKAYETREESECVALKLVLCKYGGRRGRPVKIRCESGEVGAWVLGCEAMQL